jgi:ribosomal-protein-alanine N-acetyltransferase
MISSEELGERLLLRSGSRADLQALLQIERVCFVGDYARHRFRSAEFSAYLRNPSAIFQLAVVAGHPIGYVAGTVRRTHGIARARLESIAVMPEWRVRRIGEELLGWFLQETRRREASRLTLEVAASNTLGREWFARAGFHETRQLRDYYGVGVDGVEMTMGYFTPTRAS